LVVLAAKKESGKVTGGVGVTEGRGLGGGGLVVLLEKNVSGRFTGLLEEGVERAANGSEFVVFGADEEGLLKKGSEDDLLSVTIIDDFEGGGLGALRACDSLFLLSLIFDGDGDCESNFLSVDISRLRPCVAKKRS